jgi:hypothetical protein
LAAGAEHPRGHPLHRLDVLDRDHTVAELHELTATVKIGSAPAKLSDRYRAAMFASQAANSTVIDILLQNR